MWWKLSLTVALVISAGLGGSSQLAGQKQYLASADHDATASLAQRVIPTSVLEPDTLYHKVWQLIDDEFYDPDVLKQVSWKRWEHKYDGKLKNMDDAHLAIETMLASLGDRYTRFLDRDAFDDEKSQIDAKLYGIGVQIGIDPKTKHIIVIAPIDGTPAFKAGLMPADEIYEINGKMTKGWSVEEAAKQIRGEINTEVKLTLLRGKDKIKVAVTRAEIPIKAVQTAKLLDGNVGYIRLGSFISQQATKEMRDAVVNLSGQGAKGIILDLRDNPGGLLTNAIDISNMFLDSGNIVSTVDRDGYKTQAPSDGKAMCRLPLVVLINKGSASASEITSGALRDNGRAVLVGQTTYGKGLVQGINRLDDGSGVNITIAKYLTPNDTDINKKGIAPDVLVKLDDTDYKDGKAEWWLDPQGPTAKRTPDDMKDVQLKKAVEVVHKKVDSIDNPFALKAQAPASKP
jgi:carboxyl-terminal processing protease